MKAQSVILLVIFKTSSKLDMPKRFIQFLGNFFFQMSLIVEMFACTHIYTITSTRIIFMLLVF